MKKFHRFLHIARQLIQSRPFSQLPSEVIRPGKGLGPQLWVLARPLYRFKRFALPNVPKARRSEALALEIQQWSPMTDMGRYVVWSGDLALVWAWDAKRVRAAMAEEKLSPERVPVIPETLFHPPLQQGLRLVACLSGCEGQIWRDGVLAHSRWWAERPSAGEWLNFQRDASLPPEEQDASVPSPSKLERMAKPFVKHADHAQWSPKGMPAMAAAIAAFALMLVATWYGVELVKFKHASDEANAKLEALARQAEPVLNARGRALEGLARLNGLREMAPYPDPLALMAKVAQTLPKDGAYIREWDYRDGALKIALASPKKLVSSDLVKAFLEAGSFANVQAISTSDPTTLTLNMDVLLLARIEPASVTPVVAEQAAPVAAR